MNLEVVNKRQPGRPKRIINRTNDYGYGIVKKVFDDLVGNDKILDPEELKDINIKVSLNMPIVFQRVFKFLKCYELDEVSFNFKPDGIYIEFSLDSANTNNKGVLFIDGAKCYMYYCQIPYKVTIYYDSILALLRKITKDTLRLEITSSIYNYKSKIDFALISPELSTEDQISYNFIASDDNTPPIPLTGNFYRLVVNMPIDVFKIVDPKLKSDKIYIKKPMDTSTEIILEGKSNCNNVHFKKCCSSTASEYDNLLSMISTNKKNGNKINIIYNDVPDDEIMSISLNPDIVKDLPLLSNVNKFIKISLTDNPTHYNKLEVINSEIPLLQDGTYNLMLYLKN